LISATWASHWRCQNPFNFRLICVMEPVLGVIRSL
jgi:hypothetical protein